MEKYPSVHTPKEFEKVIKRVPDVLDLTGFIEPKYDGSNITVVDGVFRTRNLNPLPRNFEEGLRSLGDAYELLIELSKQYQVFFELGGRRNAPAGYNKPWSGEWDYVVFDLMRGRLFVNPVMAQEIVVSYGLKFVDVSGVKVESVINNWKDILVKYRDYEGFVLKIPIETSVAKRIPHHRQHNMIIVKYKHEYKYRGARKQKKLVKEEFKQREPLPESEILGAINKAHLELGDLIFDKKAAMPIIFRYVREEARKHGYCVPSAGKVYNYYILYLKRLGGEA